MPALADPALSSLLVRLGIIDLSNSSLSQHFPGLDGPELVGSLLDAEPQGSLPTTKGLEDGPTLTSDEAFILRAAAIDACEMIVTQARSISSVASEEGSSLGWLRSITSQQLGAWLVRAVEERSDFRQLPMFVAKDTVFV